MLNDENTEAQLDNEAPTETPQETPEETPKEASTDPYDLMSEEDLRKELKKKRAIETRHKEKPQPSTDGDVVRKSDLETANERLARQHIQSIGNDVSAEVIANWDEIAKNYIPRRGRTTKEDIIEDVMDAHAVWKRNAKPVDTSKDAAREVAALTGTGGQSPSATPQERKRVLKQPRTMDQWYS